MQDRHIRFSRRLGATLFAFAGLIGAAAAHADTGAERNAATPIAMAASLQQCSASDALLARLRYPTGTTFKLTDAGLVVLAQPRARSASPTAWEPEWPNTGN